ncbi:DHA2 family efflux MFS transporter permease subunit [Sphingobium sp. BHU LFT2]|uniref:DHA2 family efflux MFS transporter permease subunit n=1 Tax=Sphingobium sp. BHU LFT2 TaxID=2807634 RepID=UPI001BE5F509|nr:DHA2 family efflux MFS transporter permease subunit [Sphingobium sp. BHU LFT2]MBT2246284.1 DHA2 family efflux MFS transporter permease subunit [Sphingobium sp. BHU LFT2]
MNAILAILREDWSANPSGLPRQAKLFVLGIMALGLFMALFDIQIVAASLKDVQAGLAAGPDEVSWVQTAYLMAELVMVPLSAYLAQAMSTRWLFVSSATLFTVSSLLCGLSWSIGSIIAFRALQGFTGGAMVPLVYSVGFMMFTGKDRALVPAVLGAVGVFGPTLGPSVGGFITDTIGWRWLFFVNIVPGFGMAAISAMVLRVDRANPTMFGRIDWSHFVAMAVFLAGLEYVLEEGPRHDWFGDTGIAIAGWASLVGFALFVERCFFSANPLVSLSPLRRPTFVIASLFNFIIGIGMYTSIYLVPLYLARVRGYDAMQIGSTVFVVGIAQMTSLALSTWLSQRIDVRWMCAAGLGLFAGSLWSTSILSSDWGFWEFATPNLLRGLAMMLCIAPSVTLALSGFAPTELRYASGLFNLLRNLGGAVGIALANTMLQDHSRIAQLRFGEALAQGGGAAQEWVRRTAGALHAATPDPAHAMLMARGLFGRLAGQEALTLAFNDVFRVMAWLFVAALILVPFCRLPANGAPAPTDSH